MSSNRTKSILLVEDNPSDVTMTGEALKAYGQPHTLQIANNVEQARSIILNKNGKNIDLVILDLRLPGEPGIEFLTWMKANDEFRSIPIIIHSTSDAEADVTRCYDLHCNAYLVKPSDFDAFVNQIKIVCEFWLETNVRA